MPKCTRKGCGKDYEEKENSDSSCNYHSGGPIFHEGLKSWSCCSDVNKPVLDFESFLAIPGCTTGAHSEEKTPPDPPTSSGGIASRSYLPVNSTADGQETYSSASLNSNVIATSAFPAMATKPMASASTVDVEEEDDLSVPVAVGVTCRRRGCGVNFVSDEYSRGDGEGAVCVYHPAQPIFHEGSKGYLCCKRRVLEFDEFLKIKGCKSGKHVFALKKPDKGVDDFITCRIDHYQTPTQVHVSIFAKNTDKTASTVQFEASKIYLDLLMPSSKRFTRTIDLFGPIDPGASKYTFYGTKVELMLVKADARSWTLLEQSNASTNLNFTFGVGGRTGTVGAKELILDNDNKMRLA